MFRDDLERDQSGSRENDSGNSPEQPAEPQGKEDQHRIELQASADQQRLNDLPLDSDQSYEASGDCNYARQSIERHDGDQRQQDQSGRGSGIRNEIEQSRDRAPEKWVRHSPGHHEASGRERKPDVDEGRGDVKAANLASYV